MLQELEEESMVEKKDDIDIRVNLEKARSISLKDLLQVEFHFPDGKIVFRKGIDYYPDLYDKTSAMSIDRKVIDAMRNRVIDLLEETQEQKTEWDL
jgi:hypothetical protein